MASSMLLTLMFVVVFSTSMSTAASIAGGRDPCATAPCQNEASCFEADTELGYECSCSGSWTGPRCEANVFDPCGVNRCGEHGACIVDEENDDVSRCSCSPGWTGSACEVEKIDPCAVNPCDNDGLCTIVEGEDDAQTYQCECNDSWTGPHCQERRTDACATTPCQNEASCFVAENEPGYVCSCSGDWKGAHCEAVEYKDYDESSQSDPCATDPCEDKDEAQEADVGDDACASSPCAGRGTCIAEESEGGFTCNCAPGYRGRLCEISEEEEELTRDNRVYGK